MMKKILIVLAFVGLLFSEVPLAAQVAVAPPFNMDSDIRSLRNGVAPDFNCNIGDYARFAPGVVLYLTKACTYKTMSGWGRMLVADAFSTAIMGSVGAGLKYAVNRERPNGESHSFPSGHAAAAFMTAHWMHKEMGWRSPWWTVGGYTVAVYTALERILTDHHWMSDTVAGALIGVGSVELGYFLTELIFKDKYLCEGYEPMHVHYDSNENSYFSFELYYNRRFVLARKELRENGTMPRRGSSFGLQAEFPLMPRTGIMLRTEAGSFTSACSTDVSPTGYCSRQVYDGQAGMYWEYCFTHWLEGEAYGLIGYAHNCGIGGGIELTAGLSANIITEEHFRFKGMAEWDTMSYPSRKKNFLNSIVLGFSAGLYW